MSINKFSILLLILLLGCNKSSSLSSGNTSEPEGIQGCTDPTACNFQSNATEEDGSCDYIGCTNLSCDFSAVCISITNVNQSDNSFNILLINSIPIAGFQLEFSGATITTALGGSAIENSFTVSTGNNNIVLGFSFAGATIPSGSDILTQILFTDYIGPLCIDSSIFSDQHGDALSTQIGECHN
jgi:hypothetical protein